MLFPLGTDRDGKRPAIATIVLIILNVLAYAAMRGGIGADFYPGSGLSPAESFVERFALNPRHITAWQLITYAFVHDPGGLSHLGFNMLFLWVFGKPIESHLGFLRFVPFYFAAAAVSGLVQCAASNGGVIGASGAINGVVGLFIAFFPRSQTRVLYVLVGLGVFLVPSMWLVVFFAIIDVARQMREWTGLGHSGVASLAHLGGLFFGVGVGLLLLKLKVAPRGDWDLLYLISQWHRRQQLRAMTRQANASPWMSGKPIGSVARGGPLSGTSLRQAELRAATQERLRGGDVEAALARYRELLALVPDAALPAEAQLELGNRALAAGDAPLAAQAYRNYIAGYGGERRCNDVRLLLAVLLVRRLDRRDEAKPIIAALQGTLEDGEQRALAAALATECERIAG